MPEYKKENGKIVFTKEQLLERRKHFVTKLEDSRQRVKVLKANIAEIDALLKTEETDPSMFSRLTGWFRG
jgi:hypothetical protein